MSSAAEPQPQQAGGATPLGTLAGLRVRVLQGEVGALPVILGLVLIWAIFQFLNPNFLTPRNLTNLVIQIADIGTIAVGVVLVLLLGEIDLSVGAVSGLCAAIMAVLNVKHGVAAVPAIAAGILAGLVIGLFQGAFFTRFRIPSFVVTLAGLLAWQGVLLLVLGQTGTINLFDPGIDSLAGTFLPVTAGWALAVVVIVAFAASVLWRRMRRRSAGLAVGSITAELVVPVGIAAVVILAATAVLNADRGLPLALLILLGLALLLQLLVTRTRFGRYVFAVGGNAEAARRAGIRVDDIRLLVFGLTGALAACGGILAASRLLAVNQSSGAGDVLLNSIASAVIGGTSLFGGRGSVWSAVTGALVIGSISNGMFLLSVASSTRYIVTGAVLLAAVTIDALARRSREAAGRA
jgi:D-xylose transport system permease protein